MCNEKINDLVFILSSLEHRAFFTQLALLGKFVLLELIVFSGYENQADKVAFDIQLVLFGSKISFILNVTLQFQQMSSRIIFNVSRSLVTHQIIWLPLEPF